VAEPTPTRLPEGSHAGAIAAAAMIAQQVAGKAARDAFYLSTFDVKTLPVIMAASAVVSLIAVLWLSRMMVRHSPARVVPIAFVVSGAAFLAEWALSFPAPRLAAIVLYLHTALFGAAILSAFWSLINETFVPHTGKSAVAWITGGGTLGGVLGGLAAWSVSGAIPVPAMLPALAVVNLACMWGVFRLRRARAVAPTLLSEQRDAPRFAPLRLLRDSSYLRSLALVVGLGAVTSGLLDYVFSAVAVRTHPGGHELLAFFSLFWLVVSVLSFASQVLLGRFALQTLGLATTVALLPGGVVLGGVVALVVPGLWSTGILRGGEATQRNSLFRAAYELLYTPLPEETKRSTKTLIDVGFDRLGTVAASAIALLVVYVSSAQRADAIIIVVATCCAVFGVAVTRVLHRGYVKMLEEGLRHAAEQLEPPVAATPVHPQKKIEVRDQIVEQLDERRAEDRLTSESATAEKSDGLTRASEEERSPLVQAVGDLTSGNADRIRKVLGAETPLATPLVAFAVLLLADKEVHLDTIRALRKVAATSTGQLVDALCDPSLAFDIRRRIPRVLSQCLTQHAADGLLRGLDDERFEVRYACGRALLKLTPNSSITIRMDGVVAAVERELKRAKAAWESQALDEEEEFEAPSLSDRLLHDRIDRGMEHVFNILGLHFDAASLRTAFIALHTEDAQLRGTALEYLDTVLPADIRDLVWPVLGEARPMRPARPAAEILADIVRAAEASPINK
jgi:AAA family ATP:ADP antiporter